MKTSFMLSYDLGLDGDYESLYFWLDEHKAVECGSSVALIKNYEFQGDLFDCIKNDIDLRVKIRAKDRIYIFHPKDEGGAEGRFIFGNRKRNPWEGYAFSDDTDLKDIL